MKPPDASGRIIPCALDSEESGRPDEFSSQAAVAFYADQARQLEFARPHDLLLAQVPGQHPPPRLALSATPPAHAPPARAFVGLARLDRTLAEAHVADARAPSGPGLA